MTEQNTLPYLSRFFAVACDVFDLPRKMDNKPLKVNFKVGEKMKCYTLPDPDGMPILPPPCVKLVERNLWEMSENMNQISAENIEQWLEL